MTVMNQPFITIQQCLGRLPQPLRYLPVHILILFYLAACDLAVHIPSSPDFPSLNLSHAVQVMTYTLFRRFETRVGRYTPVSRDRLNEVTQAIHESLEESGYFRKSDRFQTDRFFSDILARAGLSEKEAAHMIKVFRRISVLKNNGR